MSPAGTNGGPAIGVVRLFVSFYNWHKLVSSHLTSNQSHPLVIFQPLRPDDRRFPSLPAPRPLAAGLNYLIGLLGSMVLDWVGAVNSCTRLGILPYQEMKDSFWVTFNPLNHSGNAFAHLLTLRQGGHSITEYSFWTLAVDTMQVE